MASYRLKLTSAPHNIAGDGGLDETLVGGYSIQRTGYVDVYNGSNRKIVEVVDGEAFTDTMLTLGTYDFIETVSED